MYDLLISNLFKHEVSIITGKLFSETRNDSREVRSKMRVISDGRIVYDSKV